MSDSESPKSAAAGGETPQQSSAEEKPVEELSFSAAMGELEAILRRIESEETDIDRLAEELQQASKLLEVCRGKIRKAEVEVTQIVQELEEEEAD